MLKHSQIRSNDLKEINQFNPQFLFEITMLKTIDCIKQNIVWAKDKSHPDYIKLKKLLILN